MQARANPAARLAVRFAMLPDQRMRPRRFPRPESRAEAAGNRRRRSTFPRTPRRNGRACRGAFRRRPCAGFFPTCRMQIGSCTAPQSSTGICRALVTPRTNARRSAHRFGNRPAESRIRSRVGGIFRPTDGGAYVPGSGRLTSGFSLHRASYPDCSPCAWQLHLPYTTENC